MEPARSTARHTAAFVAMASSAILHSGKHKSKPQGWPAKKVQVLMGHSSIQVTFDIYGKLWTDHEGDLEAMALLEKKLLDGSTVV